MFVLLAVAALVAGCALIAYARWSKPLADAELALKTGDVDGALAAYGVGAERFRGFTPSRDLLARDYALLTHNRLALLYRRGEYDALIEAADDAPPKAAPHFWVGAALFAKGAQEAKLPAQLEWLTRAEDEFKLALEDAPDDWDAKYNYEVTARLTAALRNQPKSGRKSQSAPSSLMQLLRPQNSERQQRTVKKTG